MPTKLSMEKIIDIRKEIRNGKSRRQLAKELNVSLDAICKYGKYINPGPRISDDYKNLIKSEAASGKTNNQISHEYGLNYRTVQNITRKGKKQPSDLAEEEQQEIRKMVTAGITKKRTSQITGTSYSLVRDLTKDISFCNMIPFHLQKQIKEEWKNGKSKQQIAEECNVSYDTVKKYAQYQESPYRRYTDVPPEIIKEIRERVKLGISKSQVAREMRLSRTKIIRFTKELPGGSIKRKPRLSKEAIEKIIREVQGGKPKMQVSRELGISSKLVYHHTADIIVGHTHDLGIAGKTLDLLQEIMEKGYAKSSTKHPYKYYQKLRAKFPNIRRVKMYGKTIYFIQERSDEAMRDFLEDLNKKVISYQELQQIINVFQAKMGKKDKKKYLGKTN
jgi:DNA-binding CsgD family transcriptional regulator